MEHILINCTPREVRVAIVVDGVLLDLFIERDCARGLVGNVYLGKVVRVLPGMQSAFVDVGLERTAFLRSRVASSSICPETTTSAFPNALRTQNFANHFAP